MPSAPNQQQLDIAAERAKCTFDPTRLTALFYGGEEKMMQLKKIEALVDSEPVFNRDDRYFLGRTEVQKKRRTIATSCSILHAASFFSLTTCLIIHWFHSDSSALCPW